MKPALSLCQEEGYWRVRRGGTLVAVIRLDEEQQVKAVELDENISVDDRIAVLQLSLSHAMLYLRQRKGVNLVKLGKFARLSAIDLPTPRHLSAASMEFRHIPPVVTQASEREVLAALKGWKVEVIENVMLEGPEKFIAEIVGSIRGVTATVLSFDEKVVRCRLKVRGGEFTCWDIKPPRRIDHPTQYSKVPCLVVNGATNGVVGVNPVVMEVKPPASVGAACWTEGKTSSRTRSKELEIVLSTPQICTAKGQREFDAFLLALVGNSGEYVAVELYSQIKS